MEKTLALIKPDAVKAGKAREILKRIELNGFTILRKRTLQLTPSMAGKFYVEHKGKPFFEKLVGFMTSGETVAMILAQRDAIRRWRELMGPTQSALAREQAPDSIRGLFGTDGTFNAAHGSDSYKAAQREIQFFFPRTVPEIPAAETMNMETFADEAKEALAAKLDGVLLKALAALAREKPTGNIQEALRFLGLWLIENNPSRPKNTNAASDWNLDQEPYHAGIENIANEEAKGDRVEESEEQLSLEKGMTTEEAAVKVQAAFRGYCVRKPASQ